MTSIVGDVFSLGDVYRCELSPYMYNEFNDLYQVPSCVLLRCDAKGPAVTGMITADLSWKWAVPPQFASVCVGMAAELRNPRKYHV